MYLLLRALDSVDARAVDTNITSITTSNLSSFVISDFTNTAASWQRCGDIDNCRTLNQIIVSCLVTILACVWFAVHRNVPAPKLKPSKGQGWFANTALRAWYLILDQRESAIVLVVALLAPEWILAWALRQAIVAWRLVPKLEEARSKAIEAQNGRHTMASNLDKDAEELCESSDGHSSFSRSVASHTDDEHMQLINRHPDTRKAVDKCERCVARGSQCDLFAAAELVGNTDQSWGMSHAFFIAMGGFQFHGRDRPLHPLSPDNVVELVARGHLVLPTAEAISNQSKGDALSKGVAIIQTLWFVMQCIARRVVHLPVSSLEVMTLAYTVMTVAMYAAWWDKPLNVSCAVRVVVEDVEEVKVEKYNSIWELIANYVVGMQDDTVDLRQCKRVPIFWAGNADEDDAMIADAIALVVAMAFGAVHCIAWHSKFQTPLELQLWRYSAIAIVAMPVALAVVFVVGILITVWLDVSALNFGIFIGALYTPIAIIYIAARLMLIVLSFTSLRVLPAGAYQTIHWTSLIPHI